MERTTSTSSSINSNGHANGHAPAADSAQTNAATQVIAASAPVQSEAKPHQIIRPSRGWQALDLRQVWQSRDLLATLAQRDVKLRYRQTALGVAWVILQPLIAAAIFAFLFGVVANFPSGNVPYLVFAYAGQLCWNLFANTVGRTSNVLVANSQLVSKVYFPRLVLPISQVYSALVDLGVALSIMVVLMLIYRIVPTWGLLLLPVWIGTTLVLALGCGLILSALMVSYRDVAYVVPVALQLLQFASPVNYAMSTIFDRVSAKVPPGDMVWVTYAFLANPLAGLLGAFRWSLYGGEAPLWGAVIYSMVCALAVFVLGAFAFKRMEKRFADVI